MSLKLFDLILSSPVTDELYFLNALVNFWGMNRGQHHKLS